MKQDRIKKAESIAQKIISEYISEIDDWLREDHQIITVTGIKMSPDLSYMDVQVSALQNTQALTKNLAPYAQDIQRVLAKKIDFLKIPKVRFRYDETGKKMFDVHQVLDRENL